MTPQEQIDRLVAALKAAKEHLDWIGYGDTYERECARDAGLEAGIDAALAPFMEASK